MLNGIVVSSVDSARNGLEIPSFLELGDGALPGHHFSVLADFVVHDLLLVRNIFEARAAYI